MPKPKGHLTVIAEKYGKTAKFVRAVIKRHPELGSELKPGVPTMLDRNQTSSLCNAIEKDLEKWNPKLNETTPNLNTTIMQPNQNLNETEGLIRFQEMQDKIDALEKENAELRMDAGIANARAEERASAIELLRESQGQTQKLLEAAQEEASSFKPSFLGFWRKKE